MIKGPDLSRQRNFGVVAHVDAGKTTLTERLLFYSGASHKIGEVHDGAAHMDYMEEERSHGITITAAVTRLPWLGHDLQLVDTPGHVDFTIEVERSMRVLDGCVIVLDGVRGVEPQTETVWRQRSRFGLPALFFVNKMDRPGADFDHSLQTIHKRLGGVPAPVTIPLLDKHAVVHLIDRTLIRFHGEQGETVTTEPCPEAIWSNFQGQRETLLLAAAEVDEALAERVLNGEEPAPEAVWQALRTATLSGKVHPCFGGSALRNLGVQPLIDAVVYLLPSPLDRRPAQARRPDGTPETIEMDARQPLVALAFKVQLWEGRRHVFARIYRGTMQPGDKVVTPLPDGSLREEHIARLFEVDADKRNRIDSAGAGQIVLIAGLRWAATGDTLCAPGHPLLLERIDAREPVLALAIEPAASADEEKLLEVLDKYQQEDPTLKLSEDPETGQRLLRGMGELHLMVVLERLEREHHLHVRTGTPRVAMRETLTRPAVGDSLFDRLVEINRKQVAMKARVKVAVAPRDREAGNLTLIEPRILPDGFVLTQDQLAALRQGAKDLLMGGPLEGAPMEDIQVRVEEVELFGTASTPDALRAALARAGHQALEGGGAQLLRPIMAVEVSAPEENLGSVLGDLQSRQAVIQATEESGDLRLIRCEAPLDRLLGYTTDLRGMTRGRGQFSMIFRRFDQG